MKARQSLLLVLVALTIIAAVWSTLLIIEPEQQTLDVRTKKVASQLKCLICQGESVADSPSTLAQQMRTAIREQLKVGRSEQDVIQYFQQRYGDEILWSPPWQGFTLLIWLVPILFLLCGCWLIIRLLREWQQTKHAATPQEPENTKSARLQNEQQDDDLEYYRMQLEAELAADDALFKRKNV